MEKVRQNFLMTAKQVRLRFEAELAQVGSSLPIWLILNPLQDSKSVTPTQLRVEGKYEYK